MTWRQRAACRSTDPDAWFPPGTGFDDRGRAVRRPARVPDRLLAICGGCPVASECLDDALSVPVAEDLGVRAGTTPQERRKLRRLVREGRR